MTISDFIKRRCAELGVHYPLIVGHYTGRDIVRVRRQILREAHAKFPDASTAKLARAFNRDHSTIGYSLGRFKKKGQNLPSYDNLPGEN